MKQTMSKEKFLTQLRRELRRLPQDDIDNAINFYEEYLDERGEENLGQSLASLGSPKEVAVKILHENLQASPPSAKKGISAIWIVVLGIFAAPIALPLAVAALAVALVAIVLLVAVTVVFAAILFSLVVTIYALCAGLVLGGLFYIGLSLFLFYQSFATGALFFGLGLLAAGLGLVLSPACIFLSRKAWTGMKKLFGVYLPRSITKLIPKKKAGGTSYEKAN